MITAAKIFSRNEGLTPHKAPQLWGPAPERRALRSFGFEDKWDSLLEEPEGCGNQRLHSHRARTESPTLRDPGQEQSFERSQGQAHLLSSQSLQELALGTQARAAAVAGAHSVTWTLCWQTPFWHSPLSLLVPAPSTAH